MTQTVFTKSVLEEIGRRFSEEMGRKGGFVGTAPAASSNDALDGYLRRRKYCEEVCEYAAQHGARLRAKGCVTTDRMQYVWLFDDGSSFYADWARSRAEALYLACRLFVTVFPIGGKEFTP